MVWYGMVWYGMDGMFVSMLALYITYTDGVVLWFKYLQYGA